MFHVRYSRMMEGGPPTKAVWLEETASYLSTDALAYDIACMHDINENLELRRDHYESFYVFLESMYNRMMSVASPTKACLMWQQQRNGKNVVVFMEEDIVPDASDIWEFTPFPHHCDALDAATVRVNEDLTAAHEQMLRNILALIVPRSPTSGHTENVTVTTAAAPVASYAQVQAPVAESEDENAQVVAANEAQNTALVPSFQNQNVQLAPHEIGEVVGLLEALQMEPPAPQVTAHQAEEINDAQTENENPTLDAAGPSSQ